MTEQSWVTLGTGFVATAALVIGWFLNSRLTSNRDDTNRRHQMVTGYLIEAYDELTMASNRDLTPEFARMMESAVAKIQLFGTPEEIQAVHAFLDEWQRPQPDGRPRGSLDPLLLLLRNSLRQEISLPAVAGQVRWIRPLGGAQ